MPPMRISTSAPSAQQLEEVAALYGPGVSSEKLAIIVLTLVLGGAAALGGVWVTVHSFWGIPLALAGCVLLVPGIWASSNALIEAGMAREGRQVVERVHREGVMHVEIEVARALGTCGVGDDAPAAVLTDGHDGVVYLNTTHLEEFELQAGGTPSRVTMVIAAGWIVQWKADGPSLTLEDGPDEPPVSKHAEAAVLRLSEIPPAWAEVLGSGGLERAGSPTHGVETGTQ